MKIRKTLTLILLIVLTTLFSLTAKTMTVRIAAYVPEKITFEQTESTFEVNSNIDNLSYDFIDQYGYSTDAQNAQVLSIKAS